MSKKRIWLIAALVLVAALAAVFLRAIYVPKPQISSVEGKPAPDFTVKDQNGNPFQLSALRGRRVLLIFYRGYW